MSKEVEIDELVQTLSQCLEEQVDLLVEKYPDYLAQSPEPASNSPCGLMIALILETQGDTSLITESDAKSDEKLPETVLSLAFQSLIQLFLDEYVQSSSWGKPDRPIDENLNKLFALLDLAIMLQSDYSSCKRIFYELLSLILKFLLPCSVYSLGDFWNYMDTRQDTVKSRAFDSCSIADRLAVLEVHNGIINAYALAPGQSSLQNPSWADDLKSRVQRLLSNIVLFEDTTGLNKHFKIANRKAPNANVTAPFLKDILFLHEVVNNPFRVLAPTMKAEFKETLLIIKGIYTFLLREEKAYLTSHPPPRSITKMPAFTRSELSRKGETLHYFPDSYWLYSFDSEKPDITDPDYIKSKFSEQIVRTQYLFMICMLANLYIQVTVSARQELLTSVRAARNAKFITDEILPDAHKEFFETVKLDIITMFDEYDPSFGALINRACTLETTWWGWLINGKDPKTNLLLINDNTITAAELARIQDKQVLPFKDKRYFNTFITPQLSRKMRTETGLARLEKKVRVKDADLEKRIRALTEELDKHGLPSTEKRELLEERTAVYWSLLRLRRQSQWCDFAKGLKMDIIDHKTAGKDIESEEAESEVGGNKESCIIENQFEAKPAPKNVEALDNAMEVDASDATTNKPIEDTIKAKIEITTSSTTINPESASLDPPVKRTIDMDESESKRPHNEPV